MRSNLFVITDTKIHKEFCMLEARCFTIRTAVLNMMVDLTGKTHKWDFAIDIANDGAPCVQVCLCHGRGQHAQ